MSYKDAEDYARETGPLWRFFAGMIRRVLVTLSTVTSKWQVRGVKSRVGGQEVFDAELFPGIGIFARPPAASSSAEAIVLSVGGAKTPVIVATRDEATRKLIAEQVGDGETAVYNAAGIVLLKADGTIEIRSHAGDTLRLATEEALTSIYDAITTAAVVANDGGAAFKTNIKAKLDSDGFKNLHTSKLRGE